MASSWGDSWGASWGDSWGIRGVTPAITPSGGIYHEQLREALEGRKSWRQKLREAKIKAAAIDAIEHIAVRQVESLELDQQKRFEELERELEVRGVEWESRYLDILNQRRETLIHEEIGKLIHKGIEEEEIIMLLMMLAEVA